MKLYEFEGKNLFDKHKIKTPKSILIDASINNPEDSIQTYPSMIKAQVLFGKRGLQKLVTKVNNKEEAQTEIKRIFATKLETEEINQILIEETINFKEQYYICITYDTDTRTPVLLFSDQGGIEIENNMNSVKKFKLSIQNFNDYEARQISKQLKFKEKQMLQFANIIKKLYNCFTEFDCKSAEINPLIFTDDFIALDSKIEIDNNAYYRQADMGFKERASGRKPTEKEVEARKIDENDHRGVSGKTYLDLDGDIAVLSSGGGASLTCMDALLESNLKPANYTEYSGNPTREKVKKLTIVTLSKPNLKGCWIVGGTANFTDIYETLSGFIEGLRELRTQGYKIDYPIVIRRSGPRIKEAFNYLSEIKQNKEFDLHLYGEETPMTSTARILKDLVNGVKK